MKQCPPRASEQLMSDLSVIAPRAQENSQRAAEAPSSMQGPCPKARAGAGQEIRPAHWRAERKGRIPLEE